MNASHEDTDNVVPPPTGEVKRIPVAWEALEDAFENNAPEVHSYLQLLSGDVIRLVDGVAEPQMHERIAGDPAYLRVDPVSSREQYRWMERFIATVDEPDLRSRLTQSIDGKGAFRRFKDVLMTFPVDRERWFAFRRDRLKTCMESWLAAHGIVAIPRPEWEVPTADAVEKQAVEGDRQARRARAQVADSLRRRARDLVEALPARDLDAAVAFLEFLRERKHTPRSRALGGKAEDGSDLDAADGDGDEADFDE
ncbi:MAG: hypothetical protein HUU38_25075 [Anaerolineales bacterium]|nr:hypothetical protein [Deltaproteobacteria bacterium]NUM47991.1 hypothetical protein [Anaerolineales bacterium]